MATNDVAGNAAGGTCDPDLAGQPPRAGDDGASREGASGTDPSHAPDAPITAFRAWRLGQGISVHEASRRLALPYTIVRGVDGGGVPNLRNATAIVYGTRGAVAFDDLLPREERYALKRKYRYAGSTPRRALHRRARPRRPAVGG